MKAPSLQSIAEQLQGYDPQALTVAHVNAFLRQLVAPLTQTETVSPMQAHGRILAEDVISPISVPPHDNSAMDGYAFAGAQMLAGQETVLRVVGTALAGKAWSGQCGPGECVRIMTGAIMPVGLDTVVPQELARVESDQVTIAAALLETGENRRRLGEDLMQGQPALPRASAWGRQRAVWWRVWVCHR